MSDTALTLNVPLSEADRAFLLIACGDITDDSTRSRPGAGELTAQGVLDLRGRLKAANPLTPAMHDLSGADILERVTAAIEGADSAFGYQATLTQLVDGVATYRLTINGHVETFTDTPAQSACDQYSDRISAVRRHQRAAAVLKALTARPTSSFNRVLTSRGWFPADFAPAYQTVAAGGLALPADPLSRISTLPGRHADPDAFAVNLRAMIDDDAEACGICDVVFIRGDPCLTDISLGPVHARCCGPERESYVNLETGEPLADDAPIPTPWIWNADGTISPGAEVAA